MSTKQESENDHAYRTIGHVGSASLCLVLPKQFAIGLGLDKGDYVKVRQEQNKIVIEKA
jgi:antitoxin component of MazEF toxin-antitoxin module